MHMKSRYHLIFIVLVLAAFIGCTEKFDLGSLAKQELPPSSDTSYVEFFPPWGGFNSPRTMIVGNDELFYLADYGNDRVVMMNAGGHILATRGFRRPTAITQDTRLDLLVAAEVDGPGGLPIGAIIRIRLVRDRQGNFIGHDRFATAPAETVWTEAASRNRRFVGLAAMPDNQYLAARMGPDNSSFIDPDARVLLFSRGDTMITPLGDLVTGVGSGILYINKPTSIAAFPGRRDFVITQSSEGVAYGAVWMTYLKNPEFDGWLPKFNPERPEDRGVDFVRPQRFSEASGVAMDKRRGDIFIVDSRLDSVVKFDSRGRFRRESFGKRISPLLRPSGIAYHERFLYVVDTGNNIIRRYRLSTELF